MRSTQFFVSLFEVMIDPHWRENWLVMVTALREGGLLYSSESKVGNTHKTEKKSNFWNSKIHFLVADVVVYWTPEAPG